MQLTVVVLVLLAAAMHATWNALVKGSRHRLLTQALVIGTGSAIGLAALPFVDVPAREAWPFLLLSVVAHNGYYTFLLLAYRKGDLSQVYPLARGIAPLTVALLAALLAGESLAAGEVAGVAAVSLGITSLALGGGWPRGRDGRPVVYALITGLFISAYTLIDGLGVRRSGDALGYIAWMFFIEGLPLVLFAAVARRKDVGRFLKRDWRSGALGGLIATLGYSIVIWAMSQESMAHVVSLRETSVILAALIGVRAFGEGSGGRRIAAAILVALGNVFLQLF